MCGHRPIPPAGLTEPLQRNGSACHRCLGTYDPANTAEETVRRGSKVQRPRRLGYWIRFKLGRRSLSTHSQETLQDAHRNASALKHPVCHRTPACMSGHACLLATPKLNCASGERVWSVILQKRYGKRPTPTQSARLARGVAHRLSGSLSLNNVRSRAI